MVKFCSSSLPRHVPSILMAHRVQLTHRPSMGYECCYITLSRFPLIELYARYINIYYEHALDDTRTLETDRSSHADHQPRHRGRPTVHSLLLLLKSISMYSRVSVPWLSHHRACIFRKRTTLSTEKRGSHTLYCTNNDAEYIPLFPRWHARSRAYR